MFYYFSRWRDILFRSHTNLGGRKLIAGESQIYRQRYENNLVLINYTRLHLLIYFNSTVPTQASTLAYEQMRPDQFQEWLT